MMTPGSAMRTASGVAIRDNLFGLEIDPRCTQIGAFNLALAAWRRVGHCKLPAMNLACSGLAPNAKLEDWLKLAGDNDRLQRGMVRLYALFKDAPVLGSLINPCASGGDLLEAEFHELQPLLEKALAQEAEDDTAHEMAVTARGLAKAAEILAGQFTLVATNVPYLGRGKQDDVLKSFCECHHPDAKADLATCFVERCLGFCVSQGSTALVTPQNWLSLDTFEALRQQLLTASSWLNVTRLGPKAFQTPMWDFNVLLFILGNNRPSKEHALSGTDVSKVKTADEKAVFLANSPITSATQSLQLGNPSCAITLIDLPTGKSLSSLSQSFKGLGTGDDPRYRRFVWEVGVNPQWITYFSSPRVHGLWSSGRSEYLMWEGGNGALAKSPTAYLRNTDQWNQKGILFGMMADLPATIYQGGPWDTTCCPVIPRDPSHLIPLWCYAQSESFRSNIRQLNQKLSVEVDHFTQVPFDLAHWQKVAAEKYPHGLPKPFSSDPTQWLFNGYPSESDQPLHVAVARLLGYQWPRQTGSSFPDCPALGPDGLESLADGDGIVCLCERRGEAPAAERLRALLVQALGNFDLSALLASAGPKGDSKSTTLEEWLRDEFFEQHCALFYHRPFIWHIWDGHKSGFSALVNYHKLDHANLEKLTYAYLGDWIRSQQAAVDAGEAGNDARLQAARNLQARLKLILEGEPPYDLFVRWKPLAKQAIGWHPDINDGVRLNIRPFATADILRKRVKISWGPKADRGKEPKRDKAEYPWFWGWDGVKQDFAGLGKEPDGNRWNDCHYTNEFKKKAQE